MVSPEVKVQVIKTTKTVEPARISFSTDFVNENGDSFISISPDSSFEMAENGSEFEFLSGENTTITMLTADELFSEGKLLPYKETIHHYAPDVLTKINEKQLKSKSDDNADVNEMILLGREAREPRIWFVDDDPSPRPPKCTVLFKELLKLKKNQRGGSTLSPCSSSSSSSSWSSSLGDVAVAAQEEKEKEKEKKASTRAKGMKRIKKGLERTVTASLKIRPMVNVPICAHHHNAGKTGSGSLPPLFPVLKIKVDR